MQNNPASSRKSKTDEALELTLDARKKLISNEPDLVSLLRICNTVSTLLGKYHDFRWINHELNGYPEKSTVPDYRNVLGHFNDDDGDSIETPCLRCGVMR